MINADIVRSDSGTPRRSSAVYRAVLEEGRTSLEMGFGQYGGRIAHANGEEKTLPEDFVGFTITVIDPNDDEKYTTVRTGMSCSHDNLMVVIDMFAVSDADRCRRLRGPSPGGRDKEMRDMSGSFDLAGFGT